MAQIGKILTILLGMVGGLCAVLFGFAILALLFISAASVRIPGEGTEDRLIDLANGSFWYIYLGFAGIVGVVLVYINRQRPGAMLLLGTGVLGFIVSYAGSSTLMGTLTWIAPGALLILAGILALITPEKLGSILPLLKSDRQPVRRLGYAVYGIVLLLFLATLLSVGIYPLSRYGRFQSLILSLPLKRARLLMRIEPSLMETLPDQWAYGMNPILVMIEQSMTMTR